MKTKPKIKPQTILKKLFDRLVHNTEVTTTKESIDSPWPDYEELSLLPLDELEKLVKEEAIKEAEEIERATAQSKIDTLTEVSLEQKTHRASSEPYVADFSHNHPKPPLVVCYTCEDEGQDPNLKITHYPPSNNLH